MDDGRRLGQGGASKLAELLVALTEDEVDYVLVGGLAVQLHGYLRSTFDVDLVLAMNDDNLSRFIAVAKRFKLVPAIPVPLGSLHDAAQIEQWHRDQGMLAFSLRETAAGGMVADVPVSPAIDFRRLRANAVSGELLGRLVPIACIDDLLTMKCAANRGKDRLDIEALEKIKRGEDPNA